MSKPLFRPSKVWILSWRYSIGPDPTGWEHAKHALTTWLTKAAKSWVFQLEVTEVPDSASQPKHMNYHFQGYANLKEKKRPKKYAITLNEEFPGIELRACSNAGRQKLKEYAMKEQTRYHGPWADKPIYLGADLTEINRTPFPWQKDLLAILTGPVKEREILWLYDPLGAQGKSKFAKYMSFKHHATLLAYASTANLLSQASKMISTIYIVDLSRTKPKEVDENDLYAALEQIKNGSVLNTKYVTGQVNFNPPHVVVMANYNPDRKKMSMDRFVLKGISPNKELIAL